MVAVESTQLRKQLQICRVDRTVELSHRADWPQLYDQRSQLFHVNCAAQHRHEDDKRGSNWYFLLLQELFVIRNLCEVYICMMLNVRVFSSLNSSSYSKLLEELRKIRNFFMALKKYWSAWHRLKATFQYGGAIARQLKIQNNVFGSRKGTFVRYCEAWL